MTGAANESTAAVGNELAAAALGYRDRGWKPMPLWPIVDGRCGCPRSDCEDAGKHPRVRWRDADPTREEVEAWWRRWPDSGIGLLTGSRSNLFVLDLDGDDGADTLHELEREHGKLPATVRCVTGGGGEHVYFRHVDGVANTASALGPGLDTRGEGGFVVAPPSGHACGRSYAWDMSPDEAELTPPPDWLLEDAKRRGNGSAPKVGSEIPKGKRNSTLASLAGSMRRRGMDQAAIAAALKVTNAERCKPPLPEADVERIAASIARYEPAAPNAPNCPLADKSQPAYDVAWTDDKTPKLVLPDVPGHDDLAGLCAWLTCVLRLDPAHPVTGAEHQGVRGAEGHVAIRRAGAPAIRFEPAGTVSMARRLLPALGWQLIPSDGEPYGFRDEHARRIAYVVHQLCGASEVATEAQETAGIVGMFMLDAEAVEGFTTYGTGGQRYEAATALQRPLDEQTGRPIGRAHYLRDSNTGEVVIRVSDLRAAARAYMGSSLARGWLDARMDELGWQRRRVDGHALEGRAGRVGPHARVDVYRGHLPISEDGSVTT